MNKRNKFYDFVKGFLTLGIVFGHFLNAFNTIGGFESILHLVIRTYDLPFFMILGGFLLNKSIGKYSLPKVLLRKLSRVARPTIIIGGIFAIIIYIVIREFSFENIIRYIFGIWFMWSFFFCNIIVCVVSKLVKKKWLQLLIFCLIQFGFHFIPFDIWNMNFMFPFFVVGFFLPDLTTSFSKLIDNAWIKVFSLVIFMILLSFWDSSYMIWSSNGIFLEDTLYTMTVSAYRFVIGLFGCICLFYIIRMLYNAISIFIKNEICHFGEESMSIYIIHSFLINSCFESALGMACNRLPALSVWFANNYRFVILFVAPVSAFIISEIIYRFVALIKKNKIISNVIFGI